MPPFMGLIFAVGAANLLPYSLCVGLVLGLYFFYTVLPAYRYLRMEQTRVSKEAVYSRAIPAVCRAYVACALDIGIVI